VRNVKIRAITPFKVIQGHRGRYQSKARMRLPIGLISINEWKLVINSNWHPTSYRFGTCPLDTLRFWTPPPPLGGGGGSVGTTYDFHLGLIGKRVVDFLLAFIELFSLDVTAEALRAKRDRKSAMSLQRGHFDPKFQVEEDVPTNHFFARVVRPMNALQLCRWQFSQKETL